MHEMTYMKFTYLHRYMVLYCVNIPQFIQSLLNGHLGHCQFCAILNNTAVNILVCASCCKQALRTGA